MKLPRPRQRGSNWSVSIMVHGKREYCTRDIEQECLHWAMNKLIDVNSTPKEEIEAKKKLSLFFMIYSTCSACMAKKFMVLRRSEKVMFNQARWKKV